MPNFSTKAQRPADRASAPGINSAFDAAGMMGTIFKWILKRFAHLEAGSGTPSVVQIAEVEVDTLLGRVRVLRFHSGLAVGRLAAPQLARSQAEGSIVQGVGYALYEGRQIDQASGQILTTGLEDYRIPGIADTPDMDIHFDEVGVRPRPGRRGRSWRSRNRSGGSGNCQRCSQCDGQSDLRHSHAPRSSTGNFEYGNGVMNVHHTLLEFRAGGTDLSERHRSGVSRGKIVDLTPTDTVTSIAWGQDGAARIGAMVTIETLASDPASASHIRASPLPLLV